MEANLEEGCRRLISETTHDISGKYLGKLITSVNIVGVWATPN
jgi:hypothetical protein